MRTATGLVFYGAAKAALFIAPTLHQTTRKRVKAVLLVQNVKSHKSSF